MGYTLLLIDFQSGFEDADPDFESRILRLLDQAMLDGADIVLCEFARFGATWKFIRDKLASYKQKYVIRKSNQNGGYHVRNRFRRLKLERLHEVRVAGLYAEWCVKDTVITLAQLMPESQFRILKPCCIQFAATKKHAWEKYDCYLRKMDNLELK